MPDQNGTESSRDQKPKPQLWKSSSELKLQSRTKGSRGKDAEGHVTAARQQFAHIKPRLSREEIIAQFKRQSSKDSTTQVMSEDHFDKAQEAQGIVQGETAVVYDECMVEHKCLWDPNYPELPERFTSVINRCQEMGLLEKCLRIPSRPATAEEVLTRHKLSYFGILRSTSRETDEKKLEALAAKYDSIYFHPKTFELALLAAGCTIDLVDYIVTGKSQNGMAIIRPPGHHAMEAEACGYCFFNNVALAAEHALRTYQRILIVDWDIHHGQATQRMFYDDNRVLYFSVHRYEHGLFWPNLRESDFDHIGEGRGQGFNFNIPLNSTGMKNEDFMAIFHQILMPVAYEFSPELILISSGYDAAMGCPEGEMLLTPAVYAHFTSHLMTLAQGRVAVILEGGYCLESLAEGAALTLRALLGSPNPYLIEYLGRPSESIRKSILNVIYKQREFWKCFTFQGVIPENEDGSGRQRHTPVLKFLGSNVQPETYDTRDFYPLQDLRTKEKLNLYLSFIKAKTNISQSRTKLGLVYDPLMNKHYNTSEGTHPERPERITEIWARLKEFGILNRALLVKSCDADMEDLNLVHSQEHIDFLGTLHTKTSDELDELKEKLHSVYFNTESNAAALLSAGSLVRLVDYVCQGVCQRGAAVIRPPGHHAEQSEAMGFCLYNNVAVAAQHAKHIHGASRILILDWDVHHGNGTQHAFEEDPEVLYISIHRYDDGSFFPSSEDGNYDKVGKGRGIGYNVNIPWAKGGMGDAEYMAAMTQVVLPIAYQFNPQLVLVSAGFDAAIGDPLGKCKVSPECFGHMTSLLKGLAGGKIVLALEGGYNLSSISYCVTMCAKALLDDPLPSLEPLTTVHPTAIEAINSVISEHSKYWSSLCFQVDLPLNSEDEICLDSQEDDLSKNKENVQIVNYCFVPTIKREDIYSSVIADCTDDRILKHKQGSESLVRHCFCTQCPLPAHIQLHQDLDSIQASLSKLPQWGRSTKKEFLLEPKGKRSPRKAFSGPSEKKHNKETQYSGNRSHPSTPVRSSGYQKLKNRGLFDAAMKSVVNSKGVLHVGTGLVLEQTCLSHQGCPNSTANAQLTSYSSVFNRIKDLGILEKCVKIEARKASEKEISKEVQRIEYLKNISDILNKNENETISNSHVMCNMDTALLAAGSTVKIVEAVVQRKVQNGLAVVRPPNHQICLQKTPKFCFFNDVAVAAYYALENLGLQRILVFNWGPQHDQACQYVFYNDPRVLTFSVHEYKQGSQWPFLREGDFDHIGEEYGQGFNFNIPINKSKIEDQDMLAIFHQLLLPIAYEYGPELVIVSGGFNFPDLSPFMYAHMTHLLMSAARGRMVVVVQGSYTLDTIAEFTDMTLSILLGHSCPTFNSSFEQPSQEVRNTILNCVYVQRSFWKCLKFQGTYLSTYPSSGSTRERHMPTLVFKGPTGILALPSHRTSKNLSWLVKSVISQPKPRVSLVYDEDMMKHKNVSEPGHPEKPQRIQNIFQRLLEFELVDRCKVLQSREAKEEELELVHSKSHVELMSKLRSTKPRELYQVQCDYNSIYFHPDTNRAALLAAGSILQIVDSVCSGDCTRGVAVIRPPGHHAEEGEPCGFCIYNNVALAAKYAVKMHGLNRVMILDWDVHHGNGIQHMFESDPSVLYISVHRYENATFFPCSDDANFNQVGVDDGQGYNVNIPWSKVNGHGNMGDAEYMAAIMQVVLPIAYQYNPQLVLVSAGFDAAIGDPLGGCCVTPACYGHMTHLLAGLAGGRIIVALEGGYNLTSISYSMAMVVKALLGDPLPPLECGEPCKEAVSDISSVITAHSKFWSQLCFQVDLPMDNVLNKMEDNFLSVTSSPDSFYTPPTSPYKDAPVDKNSIDELVTAVRRMEIKNESKSDKLEKVMEIKECKSDELQAVDIEEGNKCIELVEAAQLAEGLIQGVLHEASVAVAQAEVTARIVVQAAVQRGIGKIALQGMAAGEQEFVAGTTVLDDVIHGDLDELAHAWLAERQAVGCKESVVCSQEQTAEGVSRQGAGAMECSNSAAEELRKEASPVAAVFGCCGDGAGNPGPSSSGENIGAGEASGEDLEALGAVGGSDSNSINTFLLTELEGAQNMFAIVPLSWCPHLETAVQQVPSNGISTTLPCEECQDPSENWICLTCYRVLCGRYVQEHMLLHAVTQEHYLTLSFSDLSVWCYACDSYVHHERLYAAKRAAHLDKFGEDIPSAWQ